MNLHRLPFYSNKNQQIDNNKHNFHGNDTMFSIHDFNTFAKHFRQLDLLYHRLFYVSGELTL